MRSNFSNQPPPVAFWTGGVTPAAFWAGGANLALAPITASNSSDLSSSSSVIDFESSLPVSIGPDGGGSTAAANCCWLGHCDDGSCWLGQCADANLLQCIFLF